MPRLSDRLFGKKELDVDDYVELDLSEYENVFEGESAELYVKIAEIRNLNDLHELKREIYNGNIVIVDISAIRKDKILIDRVIKDLKQLIMDVRGDIAGLGEEQLILTPTCIGIDREKLNNAGY